MSVNRATGIADTNFKNEDDYQKWHDAVMSLCKDLARELEDAADHLKATLSVTKVLNTSKAGFDPRRENKTQAGRVGKALMRAATAVSTAKNDVAVANQIFLQHWTKDGGLATTTSSKGRSEGMQLNQQRKRRTTKTA